MKKYLINIILLLLFSTAVLSCSKDLFGLMDQEQQPVSEYSLEISGKVSDIDTEYTLEDITITVQAMQKDIMIETKTAYTDNKGDFMLKFEGGARPSSIIVTAEDRNDIYASSRQELLIQWDSKLNIKDGVFYINNCNFFLSKQK